MPVPSPPKSGILTGVKRSKAEQSAKTRAALLAAANADEAKNEIKFVLHSLYQGLRVKSQP